MPRGKKGSGPVSVRDMTKESVTVRHNGNDIIVPTTRHEAAFMNMLMAATLRTTIEKALKKWDDEGLTPSPKELADMAKAAKDIGNLSMESVIDPEPEPEKRVEGDAQINGQTTDFTGLLKEAPRGAIEIEANEPRNPPKADGSEPDPGIPGQGNPATP